MSRIGGGNKRRRRAIGVGGAIRPVRWFSAIDTTNVDVDPCVVTTHRIHCNSSEGTTAYELIQGTSDFDVLDKQEVTITRVVGNIDVRFSQLVDAQLPQLTIPCIRMGILTVEGELSTGAYVPPDLFDAADVEETSFMWLYQCYMDRLDWSPNLAEADPVLDYAVSSYAHLDIDIGVQRKIGRAGHVMLIVQQHFDIPPVPAANLNAPFASFVSFLRVLVKT